MLDRSTPSKRVDVESALMDAEGDLLVFGLAFDALIERVDTGRQTRTDADGVFSVVIDEEQITALTHARNRLFQSVGELSCAFYGERQA